MPVEPLFPLGAELLARDEIGLLRARQQVGSSFGGRIVLEGREYINFSSNDYLGASGQESIKAAWQQGITDWGCGSRASPLVTGYTKAHAELEESLADWLGVEAVLLFSTGFAANQAVIKALLSSRHQQWQDKLNHASLQEAGAMSPARLRRFKHNDMTHLAALLCPQSGLVISEGVFSMDGDQAPCQELLALTRDSGNWLMIDDAHGFGVHGAQGRGTLDLQGVAPSDIQIVIGTFGKAFGTAGAFMAGSRQLIDYMVNFARDYVYSTHMPPSQAVASLAALRWVQQADEQRKHLQALVQQFRNGAAALGLRLMPSMTAIQPILIGDSHVAMEVATRLRESGYWVTAIRPPTVPSGSARIRITLTAAHSHEDVCRLLEGFAGIVRQWPEVGCGCDA